MRFYDQAAAIVLCSVVLAAAGGSASATPQNGAQSAAGQVQSSVTSNGRDDRYPFLESPQAAAAAAAPASKPVRRTAATAKASPPATGRASPTLVSEARKYLGTNPTGRARLWCGAFMDMVLKRTGHAGGGNLARAYASYGARVPGPKVGAIAVLRRGRGGHVGVVAGVDPNGNPILISGNHGNTVAVAVYPRSRVLAYVVPES
ncbi:MAG: TIGR02594 family protein [Pseudolabrys sp.]|nr:TIGR02594 family protein [Pseudolabrys sp.]